MSMVLQWNDKKQFRDPVYGYIQVPAPYVQYLIDTAEMQRIKGVAQSGLRPLFAAATHDRFAHSVGVYRFAMLLFKSMNTSALAALNKMKDQPSSENEWDTVIQSLEGKLKEWKNLLAIACLLHDIGHPVQSHSMEFLYDDIFLRFPKGAERNSIQRFDKTEWERTAKQYQKAQEAFQKAEQNRTAGRHAAEPQERSLYEESPFVREMGEEKRALNRSLHSIAAEDKNYVGNPHERMSAYYILTNETLREHIDILCRSYAQHHGLAQPADGEAAERKLCDDLDFICRMITGTKYNVPTNFKEENADLEYSLRNCVISILNGKIDADSMDYIMRNSYSSGYETSEVDYYRFCNALVVYPEHGQLFPAWNKSALSVIGGFIDARNYEPRWLYSHHKVVYQDILFKELLMDAVKYVALYGLPEETVDGCQKTWSDILDVPAGTGGFPTDTDEKLRSERVHYALFPHILSPFIPFSEGKYTFYRSVDGDMDAFFKQVDLDMRLREEELGSGGLEKGEAEMIREFRELYREHNARQHKKSLWKSFSEYKQVVVRIAKQLNTDFDTINGYILELIEKGLSKKQFHLQAEIGDIEPTVAKNYQSEIIYYPPSQEEQRTRANWKSLGATGQLINKSVLEIFGRFTPETCRVKIFNIRGKDFSTVQVVIGDNHYDLPEMLDCPVGPNYRFPYLFFKPKEGERIAETRKEFFQALEKYCRQRITDKPVGGNMFSAKNSNVIRDVVHGDISLPKKYQAVVDTPEFQRLRGVKQLATAAQVFPNAGHSRFSHSLGTYYVMTKMVEHFEALCQNQGIRLFNNEDERNVILLAALLHDLGHGPYSHAFECVASQDHEKWTQDILLNAKTKIHQVLVSEFGSEMPKKVADCIDHKSGGRDIFSFASLYPALISSQLDADRLDYLLRDSYNTAVQFGNVDLQNLISSMRITVIGQEYSVAIDESYLSMVEHFLFGRFKMYESVYYNAYKLFSEELLRLIFQRVRTLLETVPPGKLGMLDTSPLYKLLTSGELKVEEYISLNDTAVESQFTQWLKSEDYLLSALVRAFLYRNRLEDGNHIFQRVRVFYESDAEVQDFLRQVDKLVRNNIPDFPSILPSHDRRDASYAFINIMRTCQMYKGESSSAGSGAQAGGGTTDDKNVIWILREDGTVQDIGRVSRVLGDTFHKSYLYYSKTIFQKELEPYNIDSKKILSEVDSMIDSVHPRHMIEIEEKYSCNAEALERMVNLLPSFTKETHMDHAGFYMKTDKGTKALQVIQQEDTYYDTEDFGLQKANCSFRCRKTEKDGYIFTLKRPTDSKNFGGNEQFARFEFELHAKVPNLTEEVLSFLQSHMDFSPLIGVPSPSSDQIRNSLHPIVTITNTRNKGTVLRLTDDGESSSFEAEICLDQVLYNRPGAPETEGKPDWQVELELKSDYLDRVLLKKFSTYLRGLEGLQGLSPESDSKYQKAHQFLGIKVNGED